MKTTEDILAAVGCYRTVVGDGPEGIYMIPIDGVRFKLIVSDGRHWVSIGLRAPAWEHVSVSNKSRCPTWGEMDRIKRMFWNDDELVLQFHVPRDDHVNFCKTCLHLWRPKDVDIPLPPMVAV